MNQSSALHKPTRLQQAQSRLDSALANLERVAAEYPGGTPATSAPDSGRIEALESEVVDLRQRNASLNDTNDRVASRLDAVIARLKTAVKA